MRSILCTLSALALLCALQPAAGAKAPPGIGSNTSQRYVVAQNTAKPVQVAKPVLPGAPAAAPKPEIKSAQPQELAVSEKLTLNGQNFSTIAKDVAVTIGDKKAEVQSATAQSVIVIVPKEAPVGKQKVIISVRGVKSSPSEIVVLPPPPELTSLSLSSGAPGANLTISGKNFSPNAHENRVTIGGAEAEVDSASQGSLSVVIPSSIESPQYGVSVSVQVGKQKAKRSLTLDIQSREY
jgi:hypothetical protein